MFHFKNVNDSGRLKIEFLIAFELSNKNKNNIQNEELKVLWKGQEPFLFIVLWNYQRKEMDSKRSGTDNRHFLWFLGTEYA